MERNQVRDENISTPSGDHVPIEQGSQGSPHDRTVLDSLDPQEEGEDKQENGNGLVVVASGDGSRDITGRDAHECRSEETSRGRSGHLAGKEVRWRMLSGQRNQEQAEHKYFECRRG